MAQAAGTPSSSAGETGTARSTPLGVYDRRPGGEDGLSGPDLIAIILSVLWLLGMAVFFFGIAPRLGGVPGAADATDLRFTLVSATLSVMAVAIPLALIWVAAMALKAARVMREESQRLQTAIDAIRQSYIAQSQSARSAQTDESVQRKLDEIAAAARKTETALAMFTSQRKETAAAGAALAGPGAPAAAPGLEHQPALALGTPAEETAPPLRAEDFIRALNFPETVEDEEGFDALRRALRDRSAGQLITAAQDVLTLLSQDGIYMDDLRPDRARVDIWRAFAEGGRGRTIAALGGIRDRSSLALTAGRMKQDPIFRDAAHHFLRKFDTQFAAFADTASDADIQALAETRTARAFMLLGRVAGTFD